MARFGFCAPNDRSLAGFENNLAVEPSWRSGNVSFPLPSAGKRGSTPDYPDRLFASERIYFFIKRTVCPSTFPERALKSIWPFTDTAVAVRVNARSLVPLIVSFEMPVLPL